MATKSFNVNSSESLILTDSDQYEINASICLLWTKFKGKLRNIAIQDQRAFINYGKHQDKIIIDLVKSSCTIVNKDILTEENNIEKLRKEFDLKESSIIKKYNDIIKNLEEKFSNSEIKANKAIQELQVYKMHLEKPINLEQTNANQSLVNTSSSSSSSSKTNVPNNSNSRDLNLILTNDVSLMKCKLDDDVNLIWEELNTRLHQKFGYAEEVKRSASSDDLNWAHITLPAYINWDRMKKLHPMLKFWLQKVNKRLKKLPKSSSSVFVNQPEINNIVVEEINEELSNEELNADTTTDSIKKEKALKKRNEKLEKFSRYGRELREKAIKIAHDRSQLVTNNSDSLIGHNRNLTQPFDVFSNEQIKIIDMPSAKKRVTQWIYQKQKSDQIELAFKAYKFYHRMNLIYIYEEFKQFVADKYNDDVDKQELLERQLERDLFCALQQITPRTERRRKESSKRLRDLINGGITFDQIVDVGMSVTDFEADNIYYMNFLTALDLQTIKDLYGSDDHIIIEPTNPKAMLNKLTESINKISNLKIQEIDEHGDGDDERNIMEIDNVADIIN
ncbi:hypothetical protein GLOIN_2v1815048 [Rhizophagus clarus]|uniref:Uncharacterized protein n=1 Tax=Rhizophagus clarus TaxID=94130 RepID=A0A8H3R1A7_9GLOM|nr:hypothetical protein GLOIN_2v1815048 [Rhizophagus clarus]